MRKPVILFLGSLLVALGSMAVPALAETLLPVAAVATVAAAFLVLLSWRRGPRQRVIVDGSNVLFWNDGVPDLDSVRAVVRHLQAKRLDPGVIFDANVGYRIGSRYLDDAAMARLLGLPADRVLVVGKGTVADSVILTAARDLGARVVTNDRYRDWVPEFPEVAEPGFLIRGGLQQGQVWVDLDSAAKAA